MVSLLRLPSLLVSLALLLGACHKAEPTPEPALEGDWDLASATTTTYAANRTQLTQQTLTFPVGNDPAARYYTFTSTTRQLFASVGGASAPPEPYTRSGNVLTFYIVLPGSSGPKPVGAQTITQLISTELTLFSTEDSSLPPYGYTTFENHYTRR